MIKLYHSWFCIWRNLGQSTTEIICVTPFVVAIVKDAHRKKMQQYRQYEKDIGTMEFYYSAKKKNEMSFAGKVVELEMII